jgi:DNA-directed RNA polymerase specialized sigma subunit
MEQVNYTARKNPYGNQRAESFAAQSERDKAVMEHSDLVRYIAFRLISRLPDHIAVEDLMSAGVLGLIDAIEKYDSSQGIPFEYYAKIRIKGDPLYGLGAQVATAEERSSGEGLH